MFVLGAVVKSVLSCRPKTAGLALGLVESHEV